VFICICARVRECEVRSAIRLGALSEDAVGDACGAGTGCGTCLEVIEQMLDEETDTLVATAL
jgi:bacterioferritin-associated ferredoxin